MMKLNFVLIGCGRIADRHAEQINRFGNLVAVCDIDKIKADNFAKKFNSIVCYSIKNLLQLEFKIDVAVICTPNGLHATHSIIFLQNGYNVICEKPVCLKVDDGKKMIETAKKAGKKLFVVKSSRYTPCVIELKNAIAEQKLGNIYSFNLNCVWNRPNEYYNDAWKGTKELDGGILFTQFSHYIDVLLWLLGDVDEVVGFRQKYSEKEIEFEDSGAIAVKLKNGVIGTIHYTINATQKNEEVALNIVAEKGTVKLGGEYLNDVVYQMPKILPTSNTQKQPNDYGTYTGSMSNHDKVYENIVAALQGNDSLVTDGESALKTVEFIQKIYSEIPL